MNSLIADSSLAWKSRRLFKLLPVLWLLVGWPCCSAAAEYPWEQSPLAADPQEVLQAAEKVTVPDHASIQFLWQSLELEVDADGRQTSIARGVFRCFDRETANQWAWIDATWSPWYQERPEVSARVILPSGRAIKLDPSTIADVPADTSHATVLTDDKTMRAPLPAVRVGCIVETQVITRGKQAFFAAGDALRHHVNPFNYVHRWRFQVSLPAGVPFQLGHRGLDVEPTTSTAAGRTTWTVLLQDTEPIERFPFNLPADQALVPHVTISTGVSWAKVAEAYARVVDQRLQDQDLETYLQQVAGEDMPRDDRIAELLQLTRDYVRYTGLEFGEAAIVPHPPSEVLRRGYGDCKDQATVLVALLRKCGIDAHVALLLAGVGEDIMPDHPGMGIFNHAIVYIPGEKPLWIDPTAEFYPLGQLPIRDQHRLALVASSDTDQLERTPASTSRQNAKYQLWEFTLQEGEPSLVSIRTETKGSLAADQRAGYVGGTKLQLVKNLKESLQASLGAERVDEVDFSDPYAIDSKFRFNALCVGTNRIEVADLDAVTTINPGAVLSRLPADLLMDDDSEEAVRRQPLILRTPYRAVTRYVVKPPLGYRVVSSKMPRPVDIRHGPASLKVGTKINGDGSVQANVVFDTGNGQFSADEVMAFRSELAEYFPDGDYSMWLMDIRFEHVAERLMDAGDIAGGMVRFAKLRDQFPDDVAIAVRYAQGMLRAGLGDAARQAISEVANSYPESAMAHAGKAFVFAHSPLGDFLSTGMDREASLPEYEKAIALRANDYRTRWNYASVLAHDAHGNFNSSDAELDAAGIQLAESLDISQTEELVLAYGTLLVNARQFDELGDLRDRYPGVDLTSQVLLSRALSKGAAVLADARQLARDKADLDVKVAQLIRDLLDLREYRKAQQLYAGWPSDSKTNMNLPFGLSKEDRYYDDVRVPPGDPAWPVQQLYKWAFSDGLLDRRLQPLFVEGTSLEAIRATAEELPKAVHVARDTMINRQLSLEGRVDRLGLIQLKEDGDQRGYCVTAQLSTRLVEGDPLNLIVVPVGESYRIVPSANAGGRLGLTLLDRLRKDVTDRPREWLSGLWRSRKANFKLLDPFSTSPFYRFHFLSHRQERGDLELSAAVLALSDGALEEPLEMVDRQLPAVSTGQKTQMQRAIVWGYLAAGRGEDAVQVAKQLFAAHPRNLGAALLYCRALVRADDTEAAIDVATTWLAKRPLHRDMQRQLAECFAKRGQHQDALMAYQKSLSPRVLDLATVDLFWAQLVAGETPSATQFELEQLYQLAEQSIENEADRFFVIAAVQAERGKLADALIVLKAAVRHNYYRIAPHYYFVLGRIAEACGLNQVARGYYQRVGEQLPGSKHLADDRARLLELLE